MVSATVRAQSKAVRFTPLTADKLSHLKQYCVRITGRHRHIVCMAQRKRKSNAGWQASAISERHVQRDHASHNQRLRRSLGKGSIADYSTVCSHLLAATLHIQCFRHTMNSRVVNSPSHLMLTSLRCCRLTYCPASHCDCWCS